MAGLERDVIAKVMGPLWWRQGLRLENTNSTEVSPFLKPFRLGPEIAPYFFHEAQKVGM
jgi:hypothetical protein